MATIKTELNISVKDGPKIAIPAVSTDVDAYDKIDITLDENPQSVEVQPSSGGVSFLLITSNVYVSDPKVTSGELTYTPKEGLSISLSAPQVYLGAKAIAALLGDVQKIEFNNTLKETVETPGESDDESEATSTTEEKSLKADISILVGRAATS